MNNDSQIDWGLTPQEGAALELANNTYSAQAKLAAGELADTMQVEEATEEQLIGAVATRISNMVVQHENDIAGEAVDEVLQEDATVTSLEEYRKQRDENEADKEIEPIYEDAAFDNVIEEESEDESFLEPSTTALRPKLELIHLAPVVERQLIGQVKAGNMAAADELCRHYLPLIRKLVIYANKKYNSHGHGIPDDELIQVALQQVVPLALRHDFARGASLETRLITRIKGAIIDEYRLQSPVSRRYYPILKALEKLGLTDPAERDRKLHEFATQSYSGKNTAHHKLDLIAMFTRAGLLHTPPESVEELLQPVNHNDYNTPIKGGSGSWKLPSKDNTEGIVINQEQRAEIRHLLLRLSPKEQQAIGLYFGLIAGPIPDPTQRDLGEYFGVTESRVNQIINRGLGKLRGLMEGEDTVRPWGNRLRALETRHRFDDPLEFLEKIYNVIEVYENESLSSNEVDILLSALPPNWKHQYRTIGDINYFMLYRALPLDQRFDLTPYRTEHRKVGLKGNSIILLVEEAPRVAELGAVIGIERTLQPIMNVPEAGQQSIFVNPDVRDRLSKAEQNVVRRLYQSNSQIAFDLRLSVNTIRTQIHNAMKALDLPSRDSHLAVTAAAAGLLRDEIPTGRTEDLSKREKQVLLAYYNAYSYKATMTELQLSLRTVRDHLRNIYKKTGARDYRQAFLMAYVDKLLPQPDLSRYAKLGQSHHRRT